jgi:hypothetical protein
VVAGLGRAGAVHVRAGVLTEGAAAADAISRDDEGAAETDADAADCAMAAEAGSSGAGACVDDVSSAEDRDDGEDGEAAPAAGACDERAVNNAIRLPANTAITTAAAMSGEDDRRHQTPNTLVFTVCDTE